MKLVIGSACYDMHQRLNNYKNTQKITSITQIKEGDFAYYQHKNTKILCKIFKQQTSPGHSYLAINTPIANSRNVWAIRGSILLCVKATK